MRTHHTRGSIFSKLLIAIAIFLILFIALAAWAVWSAATAKPMGMVTDYAAQMQAAVESGQPEGQDAWPDIVRVTDLIVTIRQGALDDFAADPANAATVAEQPLNIWSIDFTAIYNTAWMDDLDAEDPSDREMAERSRTGSAIARRALDAAPATGIFETLDDIAAAPRAVRPIDTEGPLIHILLPELGKARSITRMNTARAHLAAEAGDWPEAIRSTEHSLALARHLGAQATLIEHLVGIAIQAVALQRVDLWLNDPAPETVAAIAAPLAAALDRQRSTRTIADTLNTERIWALDFIQWTHTPGGRAIPSSMAAQGGTIPGGPAAALATAPPAISNLAGFVMPSARQTERLLNTLYDQLAANAAIPRADRTDIDTEIDTATNRNWIASVLVPAVSKAAASGDLSQVHWNLTRTALAIELHRATTGSLPNTLADLTHPNAPTFTHDPITADQPLRYRIDPTQPAGYLLYSIGLDLNDDAGRPTPTRRDANATGDIVWGHADATD